MKKVRLAIGAVGAAPALGLMVPGAAVAATHAPAKTAKTVSLKHSKMAPDTGCTGTERARKHASSLYISVWHTPSTGCIGGVSALFSNHGSTGLHLRTRVYTISQLGTKTKVFSNYIGGTIHKGGGNTNITYYQGIHKEYGEYQHQVCEAITTGSHNSLPITGAVCVTFAQ